MTHLKPNTILRNRYRITGLIGAGGMGAVYLAEDQRLKGRRCAIKEQIIYDPVLAQAAQTQFEQEASILAQLDHPGLPKVSDYFSADNGDRDYLVMDYVPGQNLEQVVKQARQNHQFLNEAKVLEWIDQLCDILIYLHGCQPIVLHRDIKPANIKLTPENRVKLVDFGLAKPFDPNDPRTITGLQGLGSLPYTPIEQYVGQMGHTDIRSDIYAVGATCYHLLTGQPPLSAHDYFLNPDQLSQIMHLNPKISTHTNHVILWALQLHPDNRPASISLWHKTLRQADSLTTGSLVTKTLNGYDTDQGASLVAAFRSNSLLLVVASLLLVLSLIMTFGS